MDGFIGIHRGLRDHWIYQDAEYLKVWLEMLFLARFSEDPHIELIDGDMVAVSYGQFIFGRVRWSKRLKIGEQRLRTLITKLKKEQMIELVSEHRKCSVYALVNYAKFNHESNHQSRLLPQGIETHANQQTNQQLTISQPSANHQLTTKEQSNNVLNITTTTEPETVDQAHLKVFGTFAMNGLMQEYIRKLKMAGFTDRFVIELMLETGESGNKPSLRLMQTIGERWIREKIYTRVESKRRHDAQKKTANHSDRLSEREAENQKRLAEERKNLNNVTALKPEFDFMKEVAAGYES